MNLEFFIARRLLRGREAGSASAPIVRIAVAGIALGICVMLLSVFVTAGFKREITDKLSGFSAHIDVTSCDGGDAYAGGSIFAGDTLLAGLRALPGVRQAVPYIAKPAILKSPAEIHGILFKGVDSLYDASFYGRHLQAGGVPVFAGARASNDILLSAAVARLLGVEVGDRLATHFVQDPPRMRNFRVAGIYDTGFREYDELFALCDIRQLRRLNGWQPAEVSGIAIELEELEEIPAVGRQVDSLLAGDDNNFLRVGTLRESAPQVFDWLDLLNMNVAVILVLIIAVAGFNMVSGLLVLILDKTALIGILKALGARNASLKKLFLYIASGLIARGMLAGNLLAFLLGGIQYWFRPLALDPATYYMDTVPVHVDLGAVLLLNAGVLVLSVLMLLLPAVLISKIRPIKAIRFE